MYMDGTPNTLATVLQLSLRRWEPMNSKAGSRSVSTPPCRRAELLHVLMPRLDRADAIAFQTALGIRWVQS
jgi:hypothetical protein